ncbi:tyrosine--tRNA ligase [Clostridiaceae bacterium HSG29]|nr:tyrosine--tRNA ligase [Clostridiaceae bacterium HSG29]
MSVYDILKERGFIEQATHEDEVKEMLENESVKFYIGFDPTADSLHVGHFIQIIVMKHMQNAGHVPIALVGGGTAKVGDPSGRTDMRKMLTNNNLDKNAEAIGKQISKYLVLDGEKGILENNANWLDNLNYIDFLREIGSKFSVNRMLEAECFKSRMASGLSFLEFNYMIMQGYDFLELNRRYGCKLQLGGNDQWSNIIAGVNLVRKADRKSTYGLTFTLLTTSSGIKMGKTAKGALWIDKEKTSPFELFQYFRNVDDEDVEKTLKLLTFLPLDEIEKLVNVEGSEINKAKEVLAYEFTKIVHGKEEADKALEAAKALFGDGKNEENVPSTEFDANLFEDDGYEIRKILIDLGICKSLGEGKRLIQSGGIYINEERVTEFFAALKSEDFTDGEAMLRKGKKVHHKIIMK